MQKVLMVAAMAVSLIGCGGPKPQEISTASGKKGHVLNCANAEKALSNALLTASGRDVMGNAPQSSPEPRWGRCLQQAGDICGARGYDIVERHSSGHMVIQCKG